MSLVAISDMMPSCGATASQWIAFHKAAKKRYGKKDANNLFMALWQKRTQDNTFSSDDANTRELRNYMQTQGVTIDGTVLEGVGDSFAGFFSFIGDTMKTFLYLFIAVIVIIIIALGISLFSTAKKGGGAKSLITG